MDGSLMTAKDAVLLALALYGAILSTINWRRAAKRDTAQIKLVIRTVMPTCVEIAAVNVGPRSVTIEILTLELPSGARLFTPYKSGLPGLESTRLPARLDDGETARYVVACEEIGRALRSHGLGRGARLTPVCIDADGRVTRGKPWEVDPDALVATSQ